MLGEILGIKGLRLDRAEREMRRRHVELAESCRRLAETDAALAKFRLESLAEERRRYADLMEKRVKLRDIEWVREQVAKLRAKERDMEDALRECLKSKEQAKAAFDQSVESYHQADRAKEKFVELVRVYDEALLKAQEYAQEQEMEELTECRRERGEWDGYGAE